MLTETQARELLGLPDKDPRIDFEIDWDGSDFQGSECHEGACRYGDGTTASVHIDWTKPGYDEDTDAPNELSVQELAFCIDHARAEIAEALDQTAPFAHDDEIYIKVVVNGWYLRYAQPAQVAA
ncbi:hypothetical protein ACFO5K_04300 [Nocardia halotolerans]|uniref:Uncharacterized protein n=1 Tax=Nocardia halotolerans TaxID=1755878 RepID=A0ABV8VDZ2_9NOCA